MVDKESERRAAHPELKTLHLEKVAKITFDSDIKPNSREEDHQEYRRQITYNKNEENKGIITSKTVYASKAIESN